MRCADTIAQVTFAVWAAFASQHAWADPVVVGFPTDHDSDAKVVIMGAAGAGAGWYSGANGVSVPAQARLEVTFPTHSATAAGAGGTGMSMSGPGFRVDASGVFSPENAASSLPEGNIEGKLEWGGYTEIGAGDANLVGIAKFYGGAGAGQRLGLGESDKVYGTAGANFRGQIESGDLPRNMKIHFDVDGGIDAGTLTTQNRAGTSRQNNDFFLQARLQPQVKLCIDVTGHSLMVCPGAYATGEAGYARGELGGGVAVEVSQRISTTLNKIFVRPFAESTGVVDQEGFHLQGMVGATAGLATF